MIWYVFYNMKKILTATITLSPVHGEKKRELHPYYGHPCLLNPITKGLINQ